MVRIVDVVCSACTNKFCTSAQSESSDIIHRRPHICGPCKSIADQAKVKELQDSVAFLPAQTRSAVILSVIQDVIIDEIGAVAFWQLVANKIK